MQLRLRAANKKTRITSNVLSIDDFRDLIRCPVRILQTAIDAENEQKNEAKNAQRSKEFSRTGRIFGVLTSSVCVG